MTARNDGGPAFPVTVENGTADGIARYSITYHGMTLRDWFAGQALAGMLANSYFNENTKGAATQTAYGLADAMLTAREAKP